MKKIIFIALAFSSLSVLSQRTCGTNDKLNQLKANDPAFAVHHQEIMDYIRNPATSQTNKSPNTVVTIPVVFHILYKTSIQNISDAQIDSQLAILNADYRKLNTDFSTVVPSAFQSYGADMEIVFCKAVRTPAGAATTGVERKQVASSFVFENSYYTSSGLTAWDPTKYLNIWVGRFTNTSLLGFAYLPSAAGLAYDGLCIGDQFLGNTGTATAPFNKGRTATHEIGHAFGLRHIWGDNASCTVNSTDSFKDYCPDTPAQNTEHYDCLVAYDTCPSNPGNDMTENYMDYSNDTCMNIFTQNQKSRILAVLQNSPRRATLTSSTVCSDPLSVNEAGISNNEISIYPNPVKDYLNIFSKKGTKLIRYAVYNALGQEVLKNEIKSDSDLKISKEKLGTGYFMIIVYTEKGFKTFKFIVE